MTHRTDRRRHLLGPSLLGLGIIALLATASGITGCSDDDPNGGGVGGSEAHKRGVGADCAKAEDCTEEGQQCLPFKGGYCGVKDCTADTDCPEGSACVTHDDQLNYCFLTCKDKPGCNIHRDPSQEANCSSSVEFVETDKGHKKACVPPTGSGTGGSGTGGAGEGGNVLSGTAGAPSGSGVGGNADSGN